MVPALGRAHPQATRISSGRVQLSDVASNHAPCPPPRSSESRFALENESAGAWQHTTSKASTRPTALATSSIAGRVRGGRVCGGVPVVTAASVCHSTSHRDKGDRVGVLSNQVQSLACKQRSFFSTRTPSRTTTRSPAAPSARRSSTSRRPRALPLAICVGDVGLACVRARGGVLHLRSTRRRGWWRICGSDESACVMRVCDRLRVFGERSRNWVDAAAAEAAGTTL